MKTNQSTSVQWDRKERFPKENGLTRGVMCSIALFLYHGYPNGFGKRDAVDIFNDWANATGKRFNDADEVCAALEHVRMMMKVNRNDLAKALELDGLTAGTGGSHE